MESLREACHVELTEKREFIYLTTIQIDRFIEYMATMADERHILEHWRNYTDRGDIKHLEKDMPHSRFAYQKPNVECAVIVFNPAQ